MTFLPREVWIVTENYANEISAASFHQPIREMTFLPSEVWTVTENYTNETSAVSFLQPNSSLYVISLFTLGESGPYKEDVGSVLDILPAFIYTPFLITSTMPSSPFTIT